LEFDADKHTVVTGEIAMKVELGGLSAVHSVVDRSSKQVSNPGDSGAQNPSIEGDRTTFHSGSMQELVGQALATPEVRQNKVDALRQAIGSGEYVIDPANIAVGIISEGQK
jgi:flagellar biosynthesis anti-sigma factor FlgM